MDPRKRGFQYYKREALGMPREEVEKYVEKCEDASGISKKLDEIFGLDSKWKAYVSALRKDHVPSITNSSFPSAFSP